MSKLSLVAAATYLKFLTENRISVVCYKNSISQCSPAHVAKFLLNLQLNFWKMDVSFIYLKIEIMLLYIVNPLTSVVH